MPVFGYRIGTSRHTLKSGLPVCISAVFNPSGDFKPVAFGALMDGMRYRFKITEVKAVNDKHGVYTFDCEYVDIGRVKTVRLVYDVRSCQWTVG